MIKVIIVSLLPKWLRKEKGEKGTVPAMGTEQKIGWIGKQGR